LLHYCEHGGLDLVGLKPNPWTYLSSMLWHCRLGHSTRKTCPRYDL